MGMRNVLIELTKASTPVALFVLTSCVFGCRPHSAAPSTGKTAIQPSKSIPPGSGTGKDANPDTDPDAAPPKSDMIVAKYFAIGPGNCILLTTTSGKHILIDAGPPGSEQDVLSRLQQSDVSTLDYVIITCPTAEHIGCMAALLGGVTHGEVLSPGLPSPLMNQVEQVVKASGGKLETIRAGSVLLLDDKTTLEALAPDKNTTVPLHPTQDWYENHSLVFRVKFNNASLIFTGDMGEDERAWLLAGNANLHSSVLSGLRHGDRQIASVDFVHAVSPVVTVLMCQPGNNNGYPHKETLDSLTSNMSTMYRTDVQSDVSLSLHLDGGINISAARPGTDRDMGLPGSKLNVGVKGSGGVELDNPFGN